MDDSSWNNPGVSMWRDFRANSAWAEGRAGQGRAGQGRGGEGKEETERKEREERPEGEGGR